MEGFNCQNLQLVLGVKEGCHFDRVQRPTVIIATLNNNCRESRKIQPDCNPQYASELIWETNKNALRKMRSNQTPVKIECFAVNENGSKEKIGYSLLGVRCAQLIYPGKESTIKTNWHDILGLKSDFNNCKPRLLLYWVIREKEDKTNSISKEKEFFKFNTINTDVTPIWIDGQHLIQLGPLESCHDLFLLNITAVSAMNLNELTQEFKENSNDDFNFVYNILDTCISLKPLKIESPDVYINEKISLKIRTSLPLFMKYLTEKSHFFVRLKNKSTTIFQAELNLKPLVHASCSQDFGPKNKNTISAMEYHCVFKTISSKENQECFKKDEDINKLPHLKLHIKCQHIESKELFGPDNTGNIFRNPLSQLETNKNAPLSSKCSMYPKDQKCLDSDADDLENFKKHDDKITRSLIMEKVVHFVEDSQSIKDVDCLVSPGKKHAPKSADARKSYCLSIYLNKIKFFNSRPEIKNIEFRFYHPQGEILTTICNDIPIVAEQTVILKDVKCKLYFICTCDEIEQLLETFAPKINVCDATFDERKCIAQVALKIEQLFNEREPQQDYKAPLIDCQSGNEVGYTDVKIILVDQSNTLNKIERINLDELEDWKQKQQELFNKQLQRKEEAHLTLLNEEWKKQRESLETKLAISIEQCKVLADNLNKTTENLKIKKIQSLEREAQLIQANEELKWHYDSKLHHLQNSLQKMQQEFTTKMITLEEQNRNLILQIETLHEKKFELEKVTAEQTKKLTNLNRASLTEDQTASVLQELKSLEEKLDSAQKSKAFFKEQWGNAVKEIHKIKMENQRMLESQLKSNREELDTFNLEERLRADSEALAQDQIALNEIKQEIKNMRSEFNIHSNFNKSANELMSTSYFDSCLSLDQNFTSTDFLSNPSACDKKLNMLMEERDYLLKKGNLSNEDPVIVKLNTEIRSMLMNS